MEHQPNNTNNISENKPEIPTFKPEGATPLPSVESSPHLKEKDRVTYEDLSQGGGISLPQVVQTTDQSAVQPPIQQASLTAHPANPIAADDVDVVEKEWVDRARQIVEQTRSDPHLQEREVEKLQIDYLKKRYGREIKSNNEE